MICDKHTGYFVRCVDLGNVELNTASLKNQMNLLPCFSIFS